MANLPYAKDGKPFAKGGKPVAGDAGCTCCGGTSPGCPQCSTAGPYPTTQLATFDGWLINDGAVHTVDDDHWYQGDGVHNISTVCLTYGYRPQYTYTSPVDGTTQITDITLPATFEACMWGATVYADLYYHSFSDVLHFVRFDYTLVFVYQDGTYKWALECTTWLLNDDGTNGTIGYWKGFNFVSFYALPPLWDCISDQTIDGNNYLFPDDPDSTAVLTVNGC